ncbi:glycerophosphodiester phosphodiesterase [Acidicapsa ligni]|uniref:glycerophosphodiester phosphodiesterase n=1 Tax=Acidicapsa ligni TaxID=542300 RepID=UPI0021E09FD9|nr:glycerophosphodiester phosphodiesterase [Acidicapsa ligni]
MKIVMGWFVAAGLGIGFGLINTATSFAQDPSTRTPQKQPTEILVHGHRGARSWRPENTIPAFKFAIENGVDVLELDLAVTKDNQLVVSHNPTLAPNSYPGERICSGPKLAPKTPIRTMTLAEVREYDCGSVALPGFPTQVPVPGTKVATFDEVLDLAQGTTVQFNVETKSFPNHPELTPSPAEFVALIVAAIKKHNVDPSRIILQSFDWRTLAEMRKQWPAIRLSALVGRPQYDALMGHTDPTKDLVAIAKETGAEIISPEWMLATPEQVAAAHQYGAQVAPWTADTAEEWQKLADAHVDAIITDDPVGLLAWLRAQKPSLHP